MTQNLPYTLFTLPDPNSPAVAADSILSRTFYTDDQLKAIVFTFAPAQELSEHTASMPAVIHILSGEGTVSVGGDVIAAKPGVWVHMDANLPHSVRATTTLTMLLLLLPKGKN
jgi:quercetin dioxygenase-like cupin family protein